MGFFKDRDDAKATLGALVKPALCAAAALICDGGTLGIILPAARECFSRTGELSAHPDKLVTLGFLGKTLDVLHAADITCPTHTVMAVQTAGPVLAALVTTVAAIGTALTTPSRKFMHAVSKDFDKVVARFEDIKRDTAYVDVLGRNKDGAAIEVAEALEKRALEAGQVLQHCFHKDPRTAMYMLREAVGASISKTGDARAVAEVSMALLQIEPELVRQSARNATARYYFGSPSLDV